MKDFTPAPAKREGNVREGAPIAIWLPSDLKARYDKLQEISGRRFCKKVRELIQAAIEIAESQVG